MPEQGGSVLRAAELLGKAQGDLAEVAQELAWEKI